MPPTIPKIGLLKGLGVTLKSMLTPATTQQYPHVKPDLPPRSRGVIALMEENCTVCMLCGRECPDWCIYIDSHKEVVPPRDEGTRARTRNVLDRFAIDFALCMYCGICIEVCPFDALFWSPEFEYSTYSIRELTHEKERLRAWMDTVPPPPELEEGADRPKEITDGLQAARKAAEEAAQAAAPAAAKAEAGPKAGAAVAQPQEEAIHVEAQVDQQVFDELVAEGKSERVARAKAKAAYVRREKAKIRAQRAAESS
ncbi:MAG: NuoI/complex I 23 kDa subunit family protein [Egibacteraceae bacterium]